MLPRKSYEKYFTAKLNAEVNNEINATSTNYQMVPSDFFE